MSEIKNNPIVGNSQLVWYPAKGKKISDHEWGDICKDSCGELFLIGNAMDENDGYDSGCGCCSEHLTDHDIVEYCKVMDLNEINGKG